MAQKNEEDYATMQQLTNNWELFEKKQTYLTSTEHSLFLNALKPYRTSSFPFFIRWLLDMPHKHS